MAAPKGIDRAEVAALLAEKLSVAEIARRLGVADSTINSHRRALGVMTTSADRMLLRAEVKQDIMALITSGVSMRRTAEQLGCSRSQVERTVRAAREDPESVFNSSLLAKAADRARARRNPRAKRVVEKPSETCHQGHEWKSGPDGTVGINPDTGAIYCRPCAREKARKSAPERMRRLEEAA